MAAHRRATVAPSAPSDVVHAATSEQLVPLLRKAPALVERLTGRRPHHATLWRWATSGCAGIRLRTVTVGRQRMTSRRWLLDFFAGVDDARTRDLERSRRSRHVR